MVRQFDGPTVHGPTIGWSDTYIQYSDNKKLGKSLIHVFSNKSAIYMYSSKFSSSNR